MPYSMIALLVALALAGQFVFAQDASVRAKALVSAVFITSVLLPLGFPQWQLAGLLLQVMLVIGLVIYRKFHA